MLVILLSLTLCLMAFLPFFQTRAASEFSTPLTEMSFIEQLYQSNYIQYKYLKEKTDQKNWSYSDLYLTIGKGCSCQTNPEDTVGPKTRRKGVTRKAFK